MAKVLNISAEEVARIRRHVEMQSLLSGLNDADLEQLISGSTTTHHNIFNTSATVTLNDAKITVKRINLANLELTRDNFTSTANIFELPLFLQYGGASPGFSAWRELSALTTATNWVLSGLCPHFQMMYYWRVLPKAAGGHDTNMMSSIIKAIEFWGDAPGLITRYQENYASQAELVIFLEYLPFSLYDWLTLYHDNADIAHRLTFQELDSQLSLITNFLRTHGMLHFDANFKNILTDGQRLFLSNFYLASSKDFDLTASEINFYNRHEGYDEALVKANLVEWILTKAHSLPKAPSDAYTELLDQALKGGSLGLPHDLEVIVKNYAEHANTIHQFFLRFKNSREARIDLAKINPA